MCYGTILAKMSRVYYLFNNPSLKRKKVMVTVAPTFAELKIRELERGHFLSHKIVVANTIDREYISPL